MRLLYQIYFRHCDRELDCIPVLPDRTAIPAGEWNALVGRTGERLAGKFLWRAGKKVLYRNFRAKGGGEIDLVYRDGAILVFAEVKTRSRGEFGEPARAVDRAKQKLIIRGANAWLRELDQTGILFRFDVIEVILAAGERPQVRVSEGSFTTPQAGLGM